MVSHDREFLDGLVDKVYEFSGGMVREHLGGIYDYLRNKNAQSITEALHKNDITTMPKEETNKTSKKKEKDSDAPQLSYEERKAEQRRQNKLNKQRKTLEEQIEKLEKRKAELDELLMKPENAANMQMVNEYSELQDKLNDLEEEYFSLE